MLSYKNKLTLQVVLPTSPRGALRYLQSKPIQNELEGILEEGAASSLSVEREINLTKRGEGRKGQKIKSIVTASRDAKLQRFRLQRIPVVADAERTRNVLAKLKKTTIRSLAIQRRLDFFLVVVGS